MFFVCCSKFDLQGVLLSKKGLRYSYKKSVRKIISGRFFTMTFINSFFEVKILHLERKTGLKPATLSLEG